MYKVTRIFMGSVGHVLAWYPGIDVPLTDLDGRPTHTIFNLINQGGKSTFLSMFFTIFDPDKSRFLQHLRNNAQRFEQYFDKDGQPGLVAVEWMMPGDLASERKLVTGLIVVMKKSGELFEPDRFFFAFENAPGLSYDDLPTEQLGDGANGPLSSREDALRWLQQMETQHEGNFQRFSNQNEWRACLESRGIDVEMLRRQVEFNRTEGGMGEAFLDFRTEYDFIRKFMTLTLNPQTAEQTHATISTLCKRMGRRPKLIEAQKQLERFSQLFDPFARAAGEFHEAQKALTEIETAVSHAYATFGYHAAASMRSAEVAKRNVLEFRAEARKAEQLWKENEGMAEAYQHTYMRRMKVVAEARETTATAVMGALSHEEKLLYAAQLRAEINECLARVDSIQHNIDQVTSKQIAPLKMQRDRQATLLHYLVELELEETAQKVEGLEKRLDELGDARDDVKRESAELRTQREAALKELNQVNGLMEGAQKSLKRLRESGVIQEFETCDDAKTRLTSSLDEMLARVEDLERQVEDAQGSVVELNGRRSHREAELKVNGHKIDVLRDKIATGDAQRERLSHTQVLCRAAGAEVADVDSEVLPSRLREFIRNAMDDLATKQLRVARLSEDKDSILETQLAGRDPDVSAVVQFLASAGVKGARAFPQYLAEVLPDATAARDTVLSNPARFLGVTVPVEGIEQAQAAIENSALKLIRPVVVSAYAVDPELAQQGQFTVPSGDDSAYNHVAARRRAQTLEAEITVAAGKQKDAFQLYEDGRSALKDLDAYSRSFGNGQLDALKADEERLLESNEALRTEIEGVGAQLEATRQRLLVLGAQKKDAEGKIGNLRSELNSLQDHLSLYEAFIPEWEATQARATTEAQRCEAAVANLDTQSDVLEKQRQDTWNRKNNLQMHIDRWRPILETLVPLLDLSVNAQAELAANPRTLAAVQVDYDQAYIAVESAERETTGALTLELNSAKRDATGKEAEYGRRYPEASFAREAVEALINKDIPTLFAELGQRQAVAADEERDAIQQASNTRADYSVFVRQRKHAEIIIVGIETLDAETLDVRGREHADLANSQKAASASANEMASESETEERKFNQLAADFEQQREVVRALDIDLSGGLVVPELLQEPGKARAFVREHELKLRQTRGSLTAARTQCGNLHEKIASLARDEEFAKVDVELAMILRENTVEATINDYQRLARAAQNRRDTIDNEVASMEGDMVRGTDALLALTTDGLRILTRAADTLRLPDSVPVYGGKAVIKMNGSVGRLTSDQRREALSIYMDELCKDGNIPESGAALTAACIHRLAPNRRLDMKVLKLVSLETQQYVPVDGLSNSGAEKISMALFLYFIIAKLRYEQRADGRLSEGGVLVLDNPFSTATARSIWESIIGLADAMRIQLLLVTGIKEYDVLSVFKRFVRLKKIGHNTTKGRIHVGIVDYQFKPGSEVDWDQEAVNA
ncbi:hypothetical protein [Paraburkholderia pallida]|uniref:Chromosome segregation ATPase n=1 Tax=Paraburkholderia pallida TaxID=2547399 RepID=A0A4V1B0E3_9BURK|nr:hypothetical protein [Paraburkholderia pallida]QBR02473.1 hypothetical protein E1956_35075 [Paraburkholderia pallida]